MSTNENTLWLEAAQENFEEAISSGDIKAAKDIIADVQEAGFREEGQRMNKQLRDFTSRKEDIELHD